MSNYKNDAPAPEMAMDDQNLKAWNQESYDAWVNRFGPPTAYAEKLKKSPETLISSLLPYMDDVSGKKILNVMGSNGNKAVALALLGAEVTVVDFSEGNKDYAMALAKAAGTDMDYVVCDILKLPETHRQGQYDIVFAEMGILHYFTDLSPFLALLSECLKSGGVLIIKDFHPVSTKLIVSKGSTAKVRKHKVEGDYFDNSLIEKDVAYAKYVIGEAPKVYLRQWQLGEVVTAVADAGFCLKVLSEEPNRSSDVFDKGIPKTFTIKAVK